MTPNQKRLISIVLSVLLVTAAIAVRALGLGFVSIDMQGFLFNWYDELYTKGFLTLREPFSNYTPPYLYLLWIATKTHAFLPKILSIKFISILFDFFNAFLIYKIVRIKYPTGTTPVLGAAIFLVLPTILLNSSYWGQADAIYTCFLLATLLFLLKNQPLTAMIFFGVAFSFKAQAVFLAPLILLLVLRRQIPWHYLILAPLIYVLMMIPAWLTGRPLWELLTIYLSQSSEYRFLSLSAPNLYVFVPNSLYVPATAIGILITLTIVVLWIGTYAKRIRQVTPEILILSAFISAAIVPFLLPKMHDRYFYLADVLSLLVAFYVPRLWPFALGYQIVSGMVYYLFLAVPLEDPNRNFILMTAALAHAVIIGLAVITQWYIVHQDSPVENSTQKEPRSDRIRTFMSQVKDMFVKWKTPLLFVVILTIGIFARTWEFGSLPAGLNPDEASIGVEAYYLYKFGMDRNGMTYPVHLISWGSGQNALYAYMLIPFVALGGIQGSSVRLPMMLAGILSLPLIYIAGKRLVGEKFALTAMFLMAISPWHVVNSRWAVESNIFPFFFLLGFTALLLATRENHWFLISSVFFAICFYAYGTAYVGVPLFLLLAIPVLLHAKQISVGQVITGLIALAVIALPIGMFVAVNTFSLDTVHLGPITIPRLPVQARYQDLAAVFGKSLFQAVAENIGIMFKLLWTQADGFPWNYVEPFGYFYKVTFPLVVAGFFMMMPFKFFHERKTERWLLFAWMLASIVIGIIHPVNLTRLNLIFTPILLGIALLLVELDKYIVRLLPTAVFVLGVAFVLFTQAYHGEEYEKLSNTAFNNGIIPAIKHAVENNDSLICFTDQTFSLYIYVLLTQRIHPSEYVDRIEWIYPSDPIDPARTPRELGRFRFRIADCVSDPEAAYILTLRETAPHTDINYKEKKFTKFIVFSPKK